MGGPLLNVRDTNVSPACSPSGKSTPFFVLNLVNAVIQSILNIGCKTRLTVL